MLKKLLCGFLLISASLYSTSVQAGSDAIIVAIDDSYPPYMYGERRNSKGLYARQIKAVFNRMNVKVDVQALAWKRVLIFGEKGDFAIEGIYKNSNRLEVYDFSSPIFEETLVVYVGKGNRFPFKKISDLKGKKVGLNFGWSYGDDIDKARKNGLFAVQEVKSNLMNMMKLAHGRVDCILIDQLAASKIILHEKLSDKVEKLVYPASINKAYVAFAKSTNNVDLIKKFDQALFEMKNDGTYNKVYDDFIAGDADKK